MALTPERCMARGEAHAEAQDRHSHTLAAEKPYRHSPSTQPPAPPSAGKSGGGQEQAGSQRAPGKPRTIGERTALERGSNDQAQLAR